METDTAAGGKSMPGPRKFSELLPSSPANLRVQPRNESQIESEENSRSERIKDVIQRTTMEMERGLLCIKRVTVPTRFADRVDLATLKSLIPPAGRKALDYCLRWLENPAAIPGPLLMGKSGTYKTHLLWAVANELNNRFNAEVKARSQQIIAARNEDVDAGVLWSSHHVTVTRGCFPYMNLVVTDGAQIAHDLRGSIEARNLDEVVARYRQFGCPQKSTVLFIDDVEVMKLSDWLHEELYRIFDYRYQERMPTFVATNLSTEELRQHLGDRIARRIIDMTEPFKL